MPTREEIVEQLFTLLESLAFDGVMTDEELELFESLKTEYYIQT